MEIRKLGRGDIRAALALALKVFDKFEAPVYCHEGIEEFHMFCRYDNVMRMSSFGEMEVWGAFMEESIIGMLATKGTGHISMLFVEEEYHRQGIATALFNEVLKYIMAKGEKRITVNSSPYATGFYHKLGFADTEPEQVKNGIRYTPMEYAID